MTHFCFLFLDSDNEIGEIQDFHAGESTGDQSLARSEAVKSSGEGQRSRRKDPAERESTRLKRLLRNRVSAQQARERKKVYVNELEKRTKDLEAKNTELEEKLSNLQKENHMLRHSTGSSSGTTSTPVNMVAPGSGGSANISRDAFEANTKAYFDNLHANEKANK
ncbi:unnamed protein product [Microthlaspi erraticum]|uniref:BZIP domain-containing protein n=1 Tax=Microthlaspi erraticum TaxID=1685480 RepID=A0A6D2J6G2_9BRAS|nr:unnamed protein product [Microthlaspi erraticum]